MSDFLSRLLDEQEELLKKFDKLYSFVASDKFNSVSEKQQRLIEKQLKHMNAYNNILLERLEDLSPNNKHE
jgi:TRAP-type C4-dicarboxylate transport system substrate-binding protein